MIETLPQPALDVVRAYLALQIGGKTVPAPYVKNHDHSVFFGIRVFLGKGSPEEIQEEAHDVAKKHGIDLHALTCEEIRNFLKHHRLGVDCSGLISHVWHALYGSRLFETRQLSWYERFMIRWRPFENLSLTRLKKLCLPVLLKDAVPGDMIVTRGEYHALLIFEAIRDNGRLLKLRYVHSTSHFRESGVRRGEIVILDPAKDLSEQVWREGVGERNFTAEGYTLGKEKNGIYRFGL